LPFAPTLAVLYLSVFGSITAFWCYLFLLKQVSLMTVSTLVMVEPVIALIINHLWEHQVRLEWRTYVGAANTLSGILVGLLLKRRISSERLRSATTCS